MQAQNLAIKGMGLLESPWRTHYGNHQGAVLIGGGLYVGIEKWEQLLRQVMWAHLAAALPSLPVVLSGSVPKGQNVSDP